MKIARWVRQRCVFVSFYKEARVRLVVLCFASHLIFNTRFGRANVRILACEDLAKRGYLVFRLNTIPAQNIVSLPDELRFLIC